MIQDALWIQPEISPENVCPTFFKDFTITKKVQSAILRITALGVYEVILNNTRVSQYILAPGWTSYTDRLQYQEYDITTYLSKRNQMEVSVGKGWYRSPLCLWSTSGIQPSLNNNPPSILAEVAITYEDNSTTTIYTDTSWNCRESKVRFSEIYNGEEYDATYESSEIGSVTLFEGPTNTLIPQIGEYICEHEILSPKALLLSPSGETIIDFGQEITGYVEISITANHGDIVRLSHGEVLDKDGNFYNENYRSAKSMYHYTCIDGYQTYKPKFTYYGFRYIRIDEYPYPFTLEHLHELKAIVVHSDIKRTGYLTSSSPTLNKLFENIIWGQKGNFLDVPTDCPQRDERLGWTGDAQAFVRTAALNFNVEKFFTKWLGCLANDQKDSGAVGHVIPDVLGESGSAAWGDAATICPWEIYLAYGNKQILVNQYHSMKQWVSYITTNSTTPYLWTGGNHFGDWLGLDAPSGSYKGSSRDDLIATAFYAYSTSLVIKAGTVLKEDISYFSDLYDNIVEAFQKEYSTYHTQTECVLTIHFNLAKDVTQVVEQLVHMIGDCGGHLQTGFVGTPFLLHVLSKYGYHDLAYSLLLREEYPSWLYSVKKGATTVWEHWDGIMEDGSFWSTDMNSFNHYAYGSVADWVYQVACGIQVMEEYPGYEKVTIAPVPTTRLSMLKASFDTKYGTITSSWIKEDSSYRHDITTPVDTIIHIDGFTYEVTKGSYIFYSAIK